MRLASAQGRFGAEDFVAQAVVDLVVAVYPVWRDSVALVWHRQLARWLPPGGHIHENELPDDAAVREVREETGLDVVLVDDGGLVRRQWEGDVARLARPIAVQLELIEPGHHHADFVYAARAESAGVVADLTETAGAEWFLPEQMLGSAFGPVSTGAHALAARAVELVNALEAEQ